MAKPDASPLEGLAAMLEKVGKPMCHPNRCDQCDNVRATAARLRGVKQSWGQTIYENGYNAALRDVAACVEKP